MAEDNTPTNVVDEGIELFHSISKGETVSKNFHAGTYNAALDRSSQFYGGEQLYKIANDNLNFIQEQVNDLVSELSEKVNFENVDDMFQITDNNVTREISITLPTGNEARFNIVAETFDNTLTIKFQDVNGYDGGNIYTQELLDIDYEPDNLKTFVGDIDEIVDDKFVAEGLLDEIGLLKQAGNFNYKDGYDLYKVNIKPGANVVNIPNTAIFIENGIEKEISSDFIQGFIERPNEVNRFTDVTQIIIEGKTYDITDSFTPSQALQEHFKGADVLVYTNDIEDVGSKSYMFLNENSYVLEKVDDAQFNVDVANKYIKNNPYETISSLARNEAFTEPERYQVLLNALLDETDTPGGSLGAAKLNDPLVFDSWVDNYAKTTTSFVDNLPLVKPVKDIFLNAADNRITQLARRAATPGGILDAVDIWEIGVLALVAGAIAYNEIDEIPKIGYNAILRTYNLSQGRPIDAPLIIADLYKLEISEYDIDFEYAMETYERGEKVLPWDRTIKHLQGLEVSNDYVSTYLPKDTTDKNKNYNPYQERVEEVKELTANIKREKVKQDLLESKGVQEEKMFKQAKSKKSKATGGAGAKIL
tara:strand:- start:1735 stop:3504 length:1770 start_codon:yes stop_codon:yes gene_type:complete